MEHIEPKDIPKHITIKEITYSFKEKKANYNNAYRCIHRKCGVIINIDENNLKKIINKTEEGKIEYTKVSSKEHSCNINKEEIDIKDIQSGKEALLLGTELIKNNLDKTLEWHALNLKNNNIIISKIQIKNILQKYRDIAFPKDDIFMHDISKIKINFSETNNNLKDLLYCQGKYFIVNTNKKRQENFVIFSSIL